MGLYFKSICFATAPKYLRKIRFSISYYFAVSFWALEYFCSATFLIGRTDHKFKSISWYSLKDSWLILTIFLSPITNSPDDFTLALATRLLADQRVGEINIIILCNKEQWTMADCWHWLCNRIHCGCVDFKLTF